MLEVNIADEAGDIASVTDGKLEVSVTGVNFPDATLYIPGYATNVTLEACLTAMLTTAARLLNVASQTTASAILAKLPTGGATAANQTTGNGYMSTVVTNTGSANTQLGNILAKLPGSPSTSTMQDTINANLLSILAKMTADPSTATLQGTTNTGLADILAKLTSDPSTATLQGTINTSIGDVKTAVDAVTSKIASASATTGEYNVVMTLADTEYSQALPSNCRGIEFWTRSGDAARFAFTTGKVAGLTDPYFTLRRGSTYQSYGTLDLTGKTLYVATDTAGDVIELVTWS